MNNQKMRACLTGIVSAALAAVILPLAPATAPAADWSTTELQWQYGELDVPGFGLVPDTEADTSIITWQHASGWKYGDNFFFVDFLNGDNNTFDAYGEWYSNFSLGKISGEEISAGPISDVGVIAGVNWGADPSVIKYLPGVRLSWNLPGFAFANTDFTAYIDDSVGGMGNAPREDDSWMVDFNFSTKSYELGPLKLNLEGHVEYIGERDNEFGGKVEEWILGQPQLRADISNLLGFEEPTVFAGIEYQFWINKLGQDGLDENAVQALVVWRL